MKDELDFDFTEISIIRSLQQFQIQGTELFDDAVSYLDDILEYADKAKQGISSSALIHKNPELALNLMQNIQQLQKHFAAWDEIPETQERVNRYFSKGSVYQSLKSAEFLAGRYWDELQGGEYDHQSTFMALRDVDSIQTKLKHASVAFSNIADQTFDLIHDKLPRLMDTQGFLPKTSLKQFLELMQQRRTYLSQYLHFLDYFKDQLVRATAFSIDTQAKRLGLKIGQEDCESWTALIEKFNALPDLKEGLAELKEYASTEEVCQYYKQVLTRFDNAVQLHQSIDAIPGAKRLKYYDQILDPAICFNPGLCYGVSRDINPSDLQMAASVVPAKDDRKSEFHRYEELHELNIDSQTMLAQQNQFSRTQKNAANICMTFDEVHSSSPLFTSEVKQDGITVLQFDITAINQLITRAVTDMFEHSRALLERGYHGPSTTLIISGEEGAHAIKFRFYNTNDDDNNNKYFCRVTDANSGEFEISCLYSLDTLIRWMSDYYLRMDYFDFDTYRIELHYPKSKFSSDQYFEGLDHLEDGRYNTKITGSKPYQRHIDNGIRKQIATLQHQVEIGIDILAGNHKICGLFEQLKRPNLSDRMKVFSAYGEVIEYFEKTDINQAIDYCIQLKDILDPIGEIERHQKLHQFFQTFIEFYMGYLLEKKDPGSGNPHLEHGIEMLELLGMISLEMQEDIAEVRQGMASKDYKQIGLGLENILAVCGESIALWTSTAHESNPDYIADLHEDHLVNSIYQTGQDDNSQLIAPKDLQLARYQPRLHVLESLKPTIFKPLSQTGPLQWLMQRHRMNRDEQRGLLFSADRGGLKAITNGDDHSVNDSDERLGVEEMPLVKYKG